MLQFGDEVDKGFGQYMENFEGSFKLRIENFFEVPEKVDIESEVFDFCGFNFRLDVSPKGSYKSSEYISFKLRNLSDKQVLAAYSISLLPKSEGLIFIIFITRNGSR